MQCLCCFYIFQNTPTHEYCWRQDTVLGLMEMLSLRTARFGFLVRYYIIYILLLNKWKFTVEYLNKTKTNK